MKIGTWDGGFRLDDPNLRWGDPSYLLEPGDPGYTPPFPTSHQKRTHKTMPTQPYLPNDDAGILAVLVALDINLPGTLATKFGVDASQLLRLRHGRYAFGWFLTAIPITRQWSQSFTDARDSMTTGAPAPLIPLPGLPVLPAVPTFGTPPVTAQLESGFFDFLGRLVQQIKHDDAYDPADGTLLMIVGAEMPPPDPQIVPDITWKIGPNGCPIISVKKTPFQGYTVWVGRGAAPLAQVGFSTTRAYEIACPLPGAGQAEIWKVQVQYRYKNEPFGQKSQIVEIPVRG